MASEQRTEPIKHDDRMLFVFVEICAMKNVKAVIPKRSFWVRMRQVPPVIADRVSTLAA
jgi:hypothetical protein